MIQKNFEKVWAGSYSTNYLIINDIAVEPVAFQENDASGSLCAAISATGVTAEMQNEELIISSDAAFEVVGHLPNGVMNDRMPAIPKLDAGLYE